MISKHYSNYYSKYSKNSDMTKGATDSHARVRDNSRGDGSLKEPSQTTARGNMRQRQKQNRSMY